MDAGIAGALQHYGFDTAFIDLTSDINVAAFFAAHKRVVGATGQILIIPTEKVENQFFDLTSDFGDRPKRQKSFVIMAHPEYDLKSAQFLNDTESKWIPFRLTFEDKVKFGSSDLLQLKGDTVAGDIVDWFKTHIEFNDSISGEVRKYFTNKVTNLRVC